MAVQIELTYELGKLLGKSCVEVEATNVDEALARLRALFAPEPERFDRALKTVAFAVNGVLLRHRKALGRRLAPGDRLSLVKAAAGG